MCWAGAARCFGFPVCAGGLCRSQAVQADFIPFLFPCFSQLFVISSASKRVASVVSVLCHWRQRPLTLKMSGRGAWERKASLRDWSDYNIRGKHSELGVATECQQMFVNSGMHSMHLQCVFFAVRWHSESLRAHLHVAQVNKRLVFASVPNVLCKDTLFVFSHIHGRICCLVWLLYHVGRSREQCSEDSVEYDE